MVQSEFTHVGVPAGIFSPFLISGATSQTFIDAWPGTAEPIMAPSSDMILSPSPAAQVANMYWGSSVVRVPCLPQRGPPVRFLAGNTGGTLCKATAVRIKGERRYSFILFGDLL
jgi:hypothetical protein